MNLDLNKIILYYNTIRFISFHQIVFRLWYLIRRRLMIDQFFYYNLQTTKNDLFSDVKKLSFKSSNIPHYQSSYSSLLRNEFTFLNQTISFGNQVDWHYSQLNEGTRLWKLNLNYHEYLIDLAQLYKDTNSKIYLNFIENHIEEWLRQNHLGTKKYYKDNWSAYAISLRLTSWIKVYSLIESWSTTNFRNSLLLSFRMQLNYLKSNLEIDLKANHLLENYFSLLFCSFFVDDNKLFKKSSRLLIRELNEQILHDGGHFELSPMYHQLILYRLLDCINLLQNNNQFTSQNLLLVFMLDKARNMLHWINNITFSNGEIPLLNDSTIGVAPTTKQINEYSSGLGISRIENKKGLSCSGYRKYAISNYECVIDIGHIGPVYQPGHSHADTFNFVLNVNNEPLVIDTGISTYNAGDIRKKERGTSGHNTVSILDKDSTEVWSSFRVARRATVKILHEDESTVIAEHNGYLRQGTIHRREWIFLENQIEIQDKIRGQIREGKAYIKLAPQIRPSQIGHSIDLGDAILHFEQASSVKLYLSKIPNGFNRFEENYNIEVSFMKQLKTILKTI